MASLSKKTIGITVAVALVLGIAIAAYAVSSDSGANAPDNSGKNFSVYKDDMTMGNKNAPVTLIEYLAPTCPHCAYFNEESFPALKKKYIDTGKVLYVMRVLPLNQIDAAVEMVARCRPKDKYIGYYEYLFKHQKEWDPEYGVQDVGKALHKVSDEYGITPEAFDRCLRESNSSDEINRRAQDGQMRYNLKGTPTFIVNGTVVEGHGHRLDLIEAAIDKALAGN